MANAQVEVDLLDDGRGGHYLLHAGYKYSVKTRGNGKCYWRCVDRQCPATITTKDNIPTAFGHAHNHDSGYVGLAAESFVAQVKKRCRDDDTPIPSIFDEEIGNLRNRECDDDVVDMIRKIPTFYKCKSALYRSRAKTMPKLPASQDEICLQGPWSETLAGDRFLLCDDTDARGERILVFATDDNLHKLCAAEVVLSDGTFYSCSALFSQMYSIHASVDGPVYPLVYALLPNKSEVTYVRLFTLLKNAIAERRSVINPETWMIDFELAARNAVKTVFPLTTIRGCFFHFTQCIWRKTQECGLAIRYREDEATHKLVRRAAVLPLVPIHQVEDVWFHALEENEDNDQAITKFKDYVTETWVERNPALWYHYDNDGPRTTNNIEGWHNKFNKMAQRPHPNVFLFVKMIQKEQASNESKFIQVSSGGIVRPKKRKYRQLECRLQQLKTRYRNDEVTVLQYADAASHLLHLD